MGTTSSFGHVGHCVTDLERSRRFYVELFGFQPLNEIEVPDTPSDRLLRIPGPLGLRAAYLRKDGLILELMEFGRSGNPPAAERVVNQPGLTHMSFCVDDLPATVARVAEYGGEVLAETDIGAAIFIRDPDGQLIELLPMSYRDSV